MVLSGLLDAGGGKVHVTVEVNLVVGCKRLRHHQQQEVLLPIAAADASSSSADSFVHHPCSCQQMSRLLGRLYDDDNEFPQRSHQGTTLLRDLLRYIHSSLLY